MKQLGVPRESVEEIKTEFKDRAKVKGEKYYYYSGPLDEKTRDFCKSALSLNKVFSRSDIDVMSIELGYDVYKYNGSYNCRHIWATFMGKVITTPPPTINQIRKLIDKGIKA